MNYFNGNDVLIIGGDILCYNKSLTDSDFKSKLEKLGLYRVMIDSSQDSHFSFTGEATFHSTLLADIQNGFDKVLLVLVKVVRIIKVLTFGPIPEIVEPPTPMARTARDRLNRAFTT